METDDRGDCFGHLVAAGGLSSNYVRSLFRDHEGFVWIGTAAGLDRFDGVEVRNFPLPHAAGDNAKMNVSDICAHGKNLLVITRNDLYEYDRTTDSLLVRHSADGQVGLTALASVGDSLVLVGTSAGVRVLDRSFGYLQTLLPEDDIVDMAPYGHGFVVLTPNSIYLLTPGRRELQVESLLPGRSEIAFSCLACQGERIFVGTKLRGVYLLNPATGDFSRVSSVKSDITTSLFATDDKLYVGSNGMGLTVCYMRTGAVRHFSNHSDRKCSVASNSIYSLFVDDDGVCWVGTYSHGVSYTSNNTHAFSQYRPLEGNSIRSLRIISPTAILAGTRNGLIFSEDSVNRLYRMEDYPQIRSNIVLSLSAYDAGRFLVGTFGGGCYLYSVADGSVGECRLDERARELLLKESVYGAVVRDGGMHLVTLNGLVVVRKGAIAEHFTERNSAIPSSHLYSYLEDRDGIWLGSARGLCYYRFADRKITQVAFPDIANDFRINSISRDSHGNIWLCAEKYGLLKYRPESGRVESVGGQAGFAADMVSGIVEAEQGLHYWISTSKGIYRYNSITGGIRSFGKEQGLSSSSFCPGACQRIGSMFYFGSEDGLLTFTDAGSALPAAPQIAVTDFHLNGKRRSDWARSARPSDPPTVSMRAGDDLRLRVVVSNFKDIRAKTFAYKLSPGDEQWTYSYDNLLDFKDISKGSYRLSIRCSDDEISWSEPRVLLLIDVRTPFTRTFAFDALMAVILGGLFSMAWRLRKRLLAVLAKQSRKLAKKSQPPLREEAWMQELGVKMKEYMVSEQPYVNPDFSIKELSDRIGFSIHQISYVLNSIMGTNFAAFVNGYRVEDVKRMLDSEEVNRLTLFAIAEKCGFSSKTSFHRVFKHITGLTPQEYRKQIEGNDC